VTARAILVLGMHRSGTSALARLLSLCGAALPRHLIEADAAVNAAGFWEPREIVALHDEVLAAAGSSWHDIRSFPQSWFDSAVAASFRERLGASITREFGAAPLLVVKDPRLCRLLPLWRPVLAGLGIEPCAVIAIRNPLEVAASLEKREGFGPGISLLLWLGHVLAAELHSRDMPRCFVTYDQCLADGPGTARRIGTTLGIAWPRQSSEQAPEIAAFLSGTLRHHVVASDELFARPDIAQQIKDLYRWARRAAEGGPPPLEIPNRIRDEIGRCEPVFAPAIEALAGAAERQSDDLEHWIGVAAERYAMIERLFADVAVLQTRIEALAAEARAAR
jgi:hypothetical protein